MNRVFTTAWLKAAVIRAIKTIAQTAVATIGTAAVISSVDWRLVVSASILAGILSMLTSIAGLPEVPEVIEVEEAGPEEPEDDLPDEDDEDEINNNEESGVEEEDNGE